MAERGTERTNGSGESIPIPDPAIVSRRLGTGHYWWRVSCEAWRLVNRPGLSVIHERMPAGTDEVVHVHSKASQFFFVLEGGPLTIRLRKSVHQLAAHEGLFVAAGDPHQVENRSSGAIEFLVISQPNSRGDRHDI